MHNESFLGEASVVIKRKGGAFRLSSWVPEERVFVMAYADFCPDFRKKQAQICNHRYGNNVI